MIVEVENLDDKELTEQKVEIQRSGRTQLPQRYDETSPESPRTVVVEVEDAQSDGRELNELNVEADSAAGLEESEEQTTEVENYDDDDFDEEEDDDERGSENDSVTSTADC